MEAQGAIRGIDVEAVTKWFGDHIPQAAPPLSFSLIAGGHSNLTFKLSDAAGHEYVLRRPPLSHVLASAHDMGREHKIISALWPTPVPVPQTLGFCADPAVNGAPFYVMAFVPGVVLHDAEIAGRSLDEPRRRACGESFVDVLSDLHGVDVDAVGLGDLAKKEDYIARQLKRWYSQYQQSKTRELPAVDRVHDALKARIPPQGRASVVHGDYRLGNSITDTATGAIVAVLDWEICTLGDPLADLGYVLATWTQSTDPVAGAPGAPSLAPGFPNRDEVLERYARRSGRDVSKIDYYVAFSMWKSACIIEGVYARYVGGALGKTDVDLDQFKKRIESFAELAEQAVARFA
ncbi:MAG TPA: phosphotransferase family protein [Candidatus Binatia bacterium]|nr:phosphotransferase family protein [Candidatus Binatia bacterium]